MLHTRHTTAWSSRYYTPSAPVRVAGREPEFYLAGLGLFRSTGRFVYQQASTFIAMHIIESGRGVMRVRDRRYSVGPGDTFTFFPGQHVYYHDHPRTPWRYTWLVFQGRQAVNILAHAGITPAQPHQHGDRHRQLSAIGADAVAAYDRPQVSSAACAALAWRVIAELEQTQARQSEPRPTPAESARFIMEHHFLDGITIQDVADRLHLSRSTLFRLFKQEYRVSPKAFLESLRVDLAERMLRQSDTGLKEIALACGYHSLPYFVRAFRQARRMPPGAWRQRVRR